MSLNFLRYYNLVRMGRSPFNYPYFATGKISSVSNTLSYKYDPVHERRYKKAVNVTFGMLDTRGFRKPYLPVKSEEKVDRARRKHFR